MSIKPIDFYNLLFKKNINFFTGVPDSLLKQFCLCIDDNVKPSNHVITANEGNAIALASGYHLATGKLPLVYMQNSGLGNAVNPLLSLCDPEVYSIPLILLIGWRGEPGVKDEPQHIKQGRKQIELLEAMDIPYVIISKDDSLLNDKVVKCIDESILKQAPVAMLVKKDTFDNYKEVHPLIDNSLMTREKALNLLLKKMPDNNIIVSTTGKTSREIFEIREKAKSSHKQDFLTVGSMGHCSSIALGIALSKPNKKVVCIDGDGSLLMHMGSLSTIGKLKPKNFIHILMNNKVHESVGGQETSVNVIDVLSLIKSNNYENIFSINNSNDLICKIEEIISCDGPTFIEVLINPGSRDDLGRPNLSPVENKKEFMNFIKK